MLEENRQGRAIVIYIQQMYFLINIFPLDLTKVQYGDRIVYNYFCILPSYVM